MYQVPSTKYFQNLDCSRLLKAEIAFLCGLASLREKIRESPSPLVKGKLPQLRLGALSAAADR
jgi:hypothetical protein